MELFYKAVNAFSQHHIEKKIKFSQVVDINWNTVTVRRYIVLTSRGMLSDFPTWNSEMNDRSIAFFRIDGQVSQSSE